MKKWIILFFPFSMVAFEGSIEGTGLNRPWFTGPLLGGSGNVVQVGHFNTEPYIYAAGRSSFYDNNWNSQSIDTIWNLRFRTPFWFGLTSWADFKIAPVWGWNHRNNQSQWVLGDWQAQVGFQFCKDTFPQKGWRPSAKISIRENFPLGKYQKLDPNKLGTDAGGTGSYVTAISLNISKIYQINEHFLNLRLNFQYSIPSSVSVKGFNVYGGGVGTDGRIDPEKIFLAIVSFEYTLSRNWVLACDFQGVFSSKTRFRGYPGVILGTESDLNPLGVPPANENQAAIQYSVAPAIEYNWSENFGLITGVWLTLAGKNSSHFTTGVIAFNYYQ